MSSGPHLLVALTGHGFGHAAQACTVVRALRQRVGDLRVTIRATSPRPVLCDLFGEPFDLLDEPVDPGGFVMTSPFDVDVEASAEAYAAFHSNWRGTVAREAERLEALAPDLVLADVPYLPLAGAKLAGIPAYALCSLNWADLYRHYCGHRPEAGRIHAEILAAYREAEAFLVAEPGMPMRDLPNAIGIGPCARIGRDRAGAIRRALGIGDGIRLVLVALGGIEWRVDLRDWPIPENTHLVVHAAEVPGRPGMSAFGDLGCPMIDLLRASDAVITKSGYGLLTEAACNGTALLYATRPDWPEAPYGDEWALRNLRAAPITRDQLASGCFADALEGVLALPAKPPVAPTGGDEAAEILLKRLLQ